MDAPQVETFRWQGHRYTVQASELRALRELLERKERGLFPSGTGLAALIHYLREGYLPTPQNVYRHLNGDRFDFTPSNVERVSFEEACSDNLKVRQTHAPRSAGVSRLPDGRFRVRVTGPRGRQSLGIFPDEHLANAASRAFFAALNETQNTKNATPGTPE